MAGDSRTGRGAGLVERGGRRGKGGGRGGFYEGGGGGRVGGGGGARGEAPVSNFDARVARCHLSLKDWILPTAQIADGVA